MRCPLEFEAFLKIYAARTKSYISKFRRAFGLPLDFEQDLTQAAHIAIWKNLPYWREFEGNKSVFNWVCGPMRRAMEKTMRGYRGAKPCGKKPLLNLESEYIEGMHLGDCGLDIESTIDLKRILLADKKPQHVVRFIATALSPASGADIARANGISRQAVCMSVSRTRKRLRMAMG